VPFPRRGLGRQPAAVPGGEIVIIVEAVPGTKSKSWAACAEEGASLRPPVLVEEPLVEPRLEPRVEPRVDPLHFAPAAAISSTAPSSSEVTVVAALASNTASTVWLARICGSALAHRLGLARAVSRCRVRANRCSLQHK